MSCRFCFAKTEELIIARAKLRLIELEKAKAKDMIALIQSFPDPCVEGGI